jgi:hypothetical protein
MASQSNLWTCPGSVSPPPERSSPSPAPPPTTSSPPHPSSSPPPTSSSSFSMQASRLYRSPDTGPFEKNYFPVHILVTSSWSNCCYTKIVFELPFIWFPTNASPVLHFGHHIFLQNFVVSGLTSVIDSKFARHLDWLRTSIIMYLPFVRFNLDMSTFDKRLFVGLK